MRLLIVLLLISVALLAGCDIPVPTPKAEANIATNAAVQKANLDIQPQIVTDTEYNGIKYRMDRVPLPDGGYMYRLLSSTGGSSLAAVAKPAEPAACKKVGTP